MSENNVLVLGAGGILGREVADLILSNRHSAENVLLHLGRSHLGSQGPNQKSLSFDLDNLDEYADLLENIDILVHCARENFANSSSSALFEKILIKCPQRLRRIIYIGSAATFEVKDGEIDVHSKKSPCPTNYIRFKRNSEILLEEISQKWGVVCIVIQPGIVTASGNAQWEVQAACEMLAGKVALPNFGDGTCNVCTATQVAQRVLAAKEAEIIGFKEVLVRDPIVVTWADFYKNVAEVYSHIVHIEYSPCQEILLPDNISKLRRKFSTRLRLAEYFLRKKNTVLGVIGLKLLSHTSSFFKCPSASGYQRDLLAARGVYIEEDFRNQLN